MVETTGPSHFMAYRAEAGEKGSRNTEGRGALTQLERRATHPPSTEDLQSVPTWYYDEQVKRRDAAASAIQQWLGKTGNSPTTAAGAAPSPNSAAPRYTSPTYPRKEPQPSTNTNQESVVATYRSPVAEVAANMTIPNGGIKGSQFIKELHDNPSVRNSEVKALGLNIDPQRRYTREEMQQIIDGSTYRVEAVDSGSNNYRDTQRQPVTDPESSYHELIVTGARGFDDDSNKPPTFRARGQHFTDDTLAHTRFSIRSSNEGNYILVEEMQSDLVQAGWEKPVTNMSFSDWQQRQYPYLMQHSVDLQEHMRLLDTPEGLDLLNRAATARSENRLYRHIIDELDTFLGGDSTGEFKAGFTAKNYVEDWADYQKTKDTTAAVSAPPITNEREYTRALVQGIMGYAENNGIDEIVFPPFERIVAQRFKPGTPEYENALSEKSGFYRTYVSSLNNTIAELQDEFGAENIDVGTRLLSYTDADPDGLDIGEWTPDDIDNGTLEMQPWSPDQDLPPPPRKAPNITSEEGIYIDISKLRQNYDLTRPRFKDGGLVTQTTQALGGAI